MINKNSGPWTLYTATGQFSGMMYISVILFLTREKGNSHLKKKSNAIELFPLHQHHVTYNRFLSYIMIKCEYFRISLIAVSQCLLGKIFSLHTSAAFVHHLFLSFSRRKAMCFPSGVACCLVFTNSPFPHCND